MSDIVYLDICCFKRPFDDAVMERVRREAEAVAAVLDAAEAGRVRIVRSPAHDLENERNPREDRRLATYLWLEAALRVSASREVAERALASSSNGPPARPLRRCREARTVARSGMRPLLDVVTSAVGIRYD